MIKTCIEMDESRNAGHYMMVATAVQHLSVSTSIISEGFLEIFVRKLLFHYCFLVLIPLTLLTYILWSASSVVGIPMHAGSSFLDYCV